MAARLTQDQVIARFRAVHGDRYGYDLVEYRDKGTPVTIICPEHGPVSVTPRHHWSGSICRACTGLLPVPFSEVEERFRTAHGDRYSYDETGYTAFTAPMSITCSVHGPFMQRPDHHAAGSNCPTCARDTLTRDQAIARFRDAHGMRYGYERVEYVAENRAVTVTCREHGPFSIMPYKHWRGQGCSDCAGNRPLTLTEVIARFREVHGDLYTYRQYRGMNARVTMYCGLHGEFTATPYEHLRGARCSGCVLSERLHERAWTSMVAEFTEVHGDAYSYDGAEPSEDQFTRITVECHEHGPFQVSIRAHLLGYGCQHPDHTHLERRPGRPKLTHDAVIARFRAEHGDEYAYAAVEYIALEVHVEVYCREHGRFLITPFRHMKGHGCPTCAVFRRRLTDWEVIERFEAQHGDRYDYSKVEYTGIHKQVTITCSLHGDFPQTPHLHMRGGGCPACAIDDIAARTKLYGFGVPVGGRPEARAKMSKSQLRRSVR